MLVGSVVGAAYADSVNSPNITMNVDTNRSTGNGAGNVSVTVNTITFAETMLPEYSSGSGRAISIKARPGFQFDPTSNVTAQSATIGINGGAINAVATVVPAGTADEVLTFNFTSGTNTSVQDIIRINGIRVRILDARGAVGPAQTTLACTTSTAGGAFTNQGIVAANITKGAADRLVFSTQPGNTQSGQPILPAVTIVDFGGNIVTNDDRTITTALQANPSSGTLAGDNTVTSVAGVARWLASENLNIVTAGSGYTLRATHSGSAFFTSDSVDSAPFDILPGAPDHMEFTLQPVATVAGGDILLDVSVFDAADNLVTTSSVDITLDPAVNPGGWPLLAASSLTKPTVNGVASWGAADDLRINQAVQGYRLAASGVGQTAFTDQFDITPAAPALLAFVQQPTNTTEDVAISPPMTVEVTDEFANRTDAAVAVTLILSADGCTGNVTNDTATSSAGLATFTGVTVDAPCATAALTASSSGLVGALSDSFVVAAAPVNENVNENANENANDNANANENVDDDANVPVDDIADANACGACGAGAASALTPMLMALTALRVIGVGRARRRTTSQ